MSRALRPVSPPGATELLARMLEDPALADKLRQLSPPLLAELIRRVGLEDAGELVALATTEQLVGAFDEDLWRNEHPGEEESFDAARFALWVEVLLEGGDKFAADRLAELPEDLLSLALHAQMLVLDVNELQAQMAQGHDREEVEQIDKALTDWAYEELDDYQLMARSSDGWDAVLSAVLALDRDHHALLCRVLDRCVKMGKTSGLSARAAPSRTRGSERFEGKTHERGERVRRDCQDSPQEAGPAGSQGGALLQILRIDAELS